MKHPAFGRNLTSLPGVLPLQRRSIAYLDTNTVSNLSRWQERVPQIEGVKQLRRDLCSFASRRTIALGQWLFSELSYIEQGKRRADFLADMHFVNQLQFIQIFRSSGEMMRLEVEAFMRRVEVNPAIANALPRPLDDEEWVRIWSEERTTLTESKAEFARWEAEAEARIALHYPDREEIARHLAEDWSRDGPGLISRMVLRAMCALKDSLGLPKAAAAWPRPDQLATLWCNWSFRVTRDMLMHMELKPPKRKPSDFVDWCHFMTAAHADEFVTSDEDLLRFARAAPGPKPEILSLEEWVARLGADRGPQSLQKS